jgi:hypothetical protein
MALKSSENNGTVKRQNENDSMHPNVLQFVQLGFLFGTIGIIVEQCGF